MWKLVPRRGLEAAAMVISAVPGASAGGRQGWRGQGYAAVGARALTAVVCWLRPAPRCGALELRSLAVYVRALPPSSFARVGAPLRRKLT
jgi:hypothetical protein